MQVGEYSAHEKVSAHLEAPHQGRFCLFRVHEWYYRAFSLFAPPRGFCLFLLDRGCQAGRELPPRCDN